MGRKSCLFGFIALTFALWSLISYNGLKKILKPDLKARQKMAIGSKQIFVIKRHSSEIGLKPEFQMDKNSLRNEQSEERNFETKPEVHHIAFLKVHKAASSTIQNILFRFGFLRNLNFALPKQGNYFSKTSKKHLPLIPPKENGLYDILCLHAVFNYSMYSSILPRDTFYIASVREPWTQFVSAVNYYTSVFHIKYIEKIPGNKIENLIKYPEIYDKRSLSYTMNSMARDFGFTLKHYQEVGSSVGINSTMAYLNQLGSIFDFVLIKEYLDESLIIFKRRLGWSLKDILYIPKKVNKPVGQISEKLMEKFRKRNKLDFIIYDYFLGKFEQEKKQYGDDLIPETENLRKVLNTVNDWCDGNNDQELIIEATEWNDQFSFTTFDCTLIAKKSLEFLSLVKEQSMDYGKRSSE